VLTETNPTVSIATARSFLPDLVILDIMMPDLNGMQVCRILRADPRLAHVPIIFPYGQSGRKRPDLRFRNRL